MLANPITVDKLYQFSDLRQQLHPGGEELGSFSGQEGQTGLPDMLITG